MIPPTSIDGTDITGATIDGTDVTEITVDGQTVFTSALTFNDAIENDDLSMFQGDTFDYDTVTSKVFDGNRSLSVNNSTGNSNLVNDIDSMMFSDAGLDRYPVAGDTFEFYAKPDYGVGGGNLNLMWGVDSNDPFGSYLRYYMRNRSNSFSFVEEVNNGGNRLSSDVISYSQSEQWYRVEVDWVSSSQVTVRQFDESGNSVGTSNISYGSGYSSGGLGIGYSGNANGWYVDGFAFL